MEEGLVWGVRGVRGVWGVSNSYKKMYMKICIPRNVFSDVMSGLNFRRKGLSLLEAITNRRVSKLYVTYEDRLARFGFDLIQWLCKKFGTEVVVVNGNPRGVLRRSRAPSPA